MGHTQLGSEQTAAGSAQGSTGIGQTIERSSQHRLRATISDAGLGDKSPGTRAQQGAAHGGMGCNKVPVGTRREKQKGQHQTSSS